MLKLNSKLFHSWHSNVATGTLETTAEYKKNVLFSDTKKYIFPPSLHQGNQTGHLNSDQFTAPSFLRPIFTASNSWRECLSMSCKRTRSISRWRGHSVLLSNPNWSIMLSSTQPPPQKNSVLSGMKNYLSSRGNSVLCSSSWLLCLITWGEQDKENFEIDWKKKPFKTEDFFLLKT